jgi:hypothetical protein
LTQTTPERLTGLAPSSQPASAPTMQVVPTNATRVIETTRRAWLGNSTPQPGNTAKQARRPRLLRRPVIANLALAMNFWSTRPL